MKHFFRKTLSALTALVALGAFLPSTFPETSYADSILLGDANGDNQVTYSDATTVAQYLSGSINPSAKKITCMDVNEDYVIDRTDYYMINDLVTTGQNTINNNPGLSVNKSLYSPPNFEERTYYRHNCSDTNPASYVDYTLSVPVSSNQQNKVENDRASMDLIDSNNRNVVRITTSSGGWGSGFIISEHIVATAAHVVYSGNAFKTGVTVSIYKNSEVSSSNLLKSCSASKIHVPETYITDPNNTCVNYDYALIYVTEDLTDIDDENYPVYPFELGVAVNTFMNTNDSVTTSGFRYPPGSNSSIWRYYSNGHVKNIVTEFGDDLDGNDPELRLYSDGYSIGGKSGGPVFHNTIFNSDNYKIVLGITTGASPSTNNTWSDRITPTLLRFYYNNPYINT